MLIFLLVLYFFPLGSSVNYKENLLANQSYFKFSEFKPVLIEKKEREIDLEKELSAEGVLIKEFGGKTLYAKNPSTKFPIASLTKILSAYVALNLFSPDDILTFTQTAINQVGEVGSFKPGTKVKVIDLIQASLVASSNDSIFLLSETFGHDRFLSILNQKIKEWGLKNTVIKDVMGLSPENVSTPEEVFQFVFKIFSNSPDIFYLTTQERININGKTLWSTNLLLPKYNKIIVGGKTGYTEDAGECLVLIVKFPFSPYVGIVILNSKDRFQDAEVILKSLAKYYNYEL